MPILNNHASHPVVSAATRREVSECESGHLFVNANRGTGSPPFWECVRCFVFFVNEGGVA